MSISNDMPVTERRATDADCIVSGPASDIYLALWNRGSIDALEDRRRSGRDRPAARERAHSLGLGRERYNQSRLRNMRYRTTLSTSIMPSAIG